jgi:DeoR/GlpR family transcriptional regulator of sugar metabolism
VTNQTISNDLTNFPAVGKLKPAKTARAVQIATQLGVSQSTIPRDLETLGMMPNVKWSAL